MLHHLVGLPVAEVAVELGLPVGTVKAWLSGHCPAAPGPAGLTPRSSSTREPARPPLWPLSAVRWKRPRGDPRRLRVARRRHQPIPDRFRPQEPQEPWRSWPRSWGQACAGRRRRRLGRRERGAGASATATGTATGGHLSRQFCLAYGESPYGYLMTRRIERAIALLRRGDRSLRGLLPGRLCLAGQPQQSLHRVGRDAPAPSAQAARATAGMLPCAAKQVTRPGQESRSAAPEPQLT